MKIEVAGSHNIKFKEVLNEVKKNGKNEFSLDLEEYSINVSFGKSEDKILFLKHFLTHCLLTTKIPDVSVSILKGENVILKGNYSYMEGVSDEELIVSFKGDSFVEFNISFFPKDIIEFEKFFEEVF